MTFCCWMSSVWRFKATSFLPSLIVRRSEKTVFPWHKLFAQFWTSRFRKIKPCNFWDDFSRFGGTSCFLCHGKTFSSTVNKVVRSPTVHWFLPTKLQCLTFRKTIIFRKDFYLPELVGVRVGHDSVPSTNTSQFFTCVRDHIDAAGGQSWHLTSGTFHDSARNKASLFLQIVSIQCVRIFGVILNYFLQCNSLISWKTFSFNFSNWEECRLYVAWLEQGVLCLQYVTRFYRAPVSVILRP
jgi:hypothetical protein